MKERAPRNRTLTVDAARYAECARELLRLQAPISEDALQNRIIHGDLLSVLEFLPSHFVDLMIIDPPYNLSKYFDGGYFGSRSNEEYLSYLRSWFPALMRLLKPDATVYLCGDWRCSPAQFVVMNEFLHIRNRITWEREKGRGARANWKNCCEDIWFGTVGDDYYFNVDAVKIRRRVLAPYRVNGRPKDWQETPEGNIRMTCPSNFWDDISIPYWSMAENTDHPTQKPEKLMAKLILASSEPGDIVFDPFVGSGTTAVTAKKLGRRYLGIDINETYCCWAIERLHRAESTPDIQGYSEGVFWERNSQPARKHPKNEK